MAKVRIFCQLLSLVGHVSQKIESVAFIVTINDRRKLLFMQLYDFANCQTQTIEKAVMFFTDRPPGQC